MKSPKRTNPEARMSVFEHLKELRKRLILVLIGLGIGAIAGWYLYDRAMEFIQRPLAELNASNVTINFQTIGAAFDLKLTVALWISAIITSPWWITQLGLFIMPALKKREKILTLIFGIVGALLFCLGALSGMWVVPRAVEILQSFVPSDAMSLLQAQSYVQFYMRLVIAFGISFLAPEVLVALNFAGLMSAKTMLRGWRWATVIAFLFAAITNPLPSPWPMIVQASILLSFYFIAVLIAWLHERILKRKSKRTSE